YHLPLSFSRPATPRALHSFPTRRSSDLSPNRMNALQRAWLAESVPQCGYCQSGQLMSAAALLAANTRPTREEIKDHMSANVCRCGTYPRIVRAIERAVREG